MRVPISTLRKMVLAAGSAGAIALVTNAGALGQDVYRPSAERGRTPIADGILKITASPTFILGSPGVIFGPRDSAFNLETSVNMPDWEKALCRPLPEDTPGQPPGWIWNETSVKWQFLPPVERYNCIT